jgi:capsular polysaccharide biosynthesis protein
MSLGSGHTSLGWLRRRGWWLIPIATVLGAVAAFWAARPGPPTYTAEAVLLVQSGAGVNDPGTATEANRLAGTYAQVIPADTRIQQAVGRALKVTPDTVAKAITAANPNNTALIRLTYQASDAKTAVRGANAVAVAVSGIPPASPSIASGLTVISSIPTSASSSTRGTASAIPVGALLGLGVSILTLIAWERSDARVEDEEALAHEIDGPASRLEGLTAPSARVLLDRWAELADRGNSRIALIAAANRNGPEVATAAREFVRRAAGGRLRATVLLEGSTDAARPGDVDVTLVPGGRPGPAESGETTARSCDVTVMVCLAETKVSDLRASLAVLEDFGIRPVWALLVDPRRRSPFDGIPMPVSTRDARSVPAVRAQKPVEQSDASVEPTPSFPHQ